MAQWCEYASDLQDDGNFEWDNDKRVYPNGKVEELHYRQWEAGEWVGKSESTFAISSALPILISHWCTPRGRSSSLKAMTWNPMKKNQATSSQSDMYISTQLRIGLAEQAYSLQPASCAQCSAL